MSAESPPPLFDTHCHLDDKRLRKDREGVLQRARDAGVTRLVTIGCARDPSAVRRPIEIAREHEGWIRATVGVHPHDASKLDDRMVAALAEAAEDPLVVAVGEMGLDYHYDRSPRDAQREAFRREIALARQVRKPIVVHTRNAADDTLTILREERASDVGGIIHCFSEDSAFAKAALDLGFVASFSGLVTFPKGVDHIRDAAAAQPRDAILVETDAPYLAPEPHRGTTNEPSYVAHTAAAIAELRGEDLEELRRATTDNARRVFGW